MDFRMAKNFSILRSQRGMMLNLRATFLIVALLTCCTTDDPSPAQLDLKVSTITRTYWDGASSVMQLFYEGDDLVRVQRGNSREWLFFYQTDRLEQVVYRQDQESDTTTFEYDALGRITKVFNDKTGTPQLKRFFEYHTGETWITDEIGDYVIYQFDEKGNRVAINMYYSNGNLFHTRSTLYDDHPNFLKSAGLTFHHVTLPLMGASYPTIGAYSYSDLLDVNNPISARVLDSSGSIIQKWDFTYQYNEEGYPVVISSPPPGPDLYSYELTIEYLKN